MRLIYTFNLSLLYSSSKTKKLQTLFKYTGVIIDALSVAKWPHQIDPQTADNKYAMQELVQCTMYNMQCVKTNSFPQVPNLKSMGFAAS